MPAKPRKKWWPRVLAAAHYGFPMCMLILGWFAFREGDCAYKPSAAETYLVCSAVVIVAVFTGEIALALNSIRERLERHGTHLLSHKANIERLESRLALLENTSRELGANQPEPGLSICLEQVPVIQEPRIRYQETDPGQPTSSQTFAQAAPTPPSLERLSESDAIHAIKSEFIEACRNQNRDLSQIIKRLQVLIDESAPSTFRAIRVSRDGAIEESVIYRTDATGIAAPKDSIAILIGGNQALLFPAPLAGEDSFVDAKAFKSDMPVHQRKRKHLADCDPALLTGTEKDGFALHQPGRLRFSQV